MNDEFFALKPSIDACLSDTSESPSIVQPEDEPFLNFDPNSKMSFDGKSRVYNSLVTLVKAEYPFEKALQDRAARLLKCLEPTWRDEPRDVAELVTDLVPTSDGSPSGFVASIVTLLSSPHSTIVTAALSLVSAAVCHSDITNQYRLIDANVMITVLGIIQPHTLPISGNETILKDLVGMFEQGVRRADYESPISYASYRPSDKSNYREMILQKVVLPSSQFERYLISNRYLLNGDLLQSFIILLVRFFKASPYHPPTLEYVLASPMAMAFPSCFSIIENDFRVWATLANICFAIYDWRKGGAEVIESAKRMMQALFSEGFDDILEVMTMNKTQGKLGGGPLTESHPLTKELGLHVPMMWKVASPVAQ
ncbi:hypothetical protein BLNAU_4932 [Blattamonas nauphoetae]|uniref:Uncharacterized protein n=1 Tax=Blattamonas nauphoetae TaxID=2049346 RepID=A0ABQ9Y8R1_9EUKA|nr:hypothetical protein BLNAU_4932 [Blattamonas nauphoetae]